MRNHLRLVLSPITNQLERVPDARRHDDDLAGAGTPPPAPVNRAQLAIPFRVMAANAGSQLAHTSQTFARDASAEKGRAIHD